MYDTNIRHFCQSRKHSLADLQLKRVATINYTELTAGISSSSSSLLLSSALQPRVGLGLLANISVNLLRYSRGGQGQFNLNDPHLWLDMKEKLFRSFERL